MKKYIFPILILLIILSLCACGDANTAEQSLLADADKSLMSNRDLLASQNWLNIHDGDIYILNADGSGSHNGISITYTLEEDELFVTEGVASIQAKSFHLDRSGGYPRLIAEGENSFYVVEEDYKELAPKVRRESIHILMSCESWKASTVDGYLFFYENGTGCLKYPANNLSQDTTWEMVDNNTLRCYIPVDSTKQGVNTLEIVNENGQYTLRTDDPDVYYTPHGDAPVHQAISNPIVSVDAGYGYTVCLKKDGTASAVGNNERGQCNVDGWKDLEAISGDNMHTVGLLSDGTVIFAGDNSNGQCNVGKWTNVTSIEASYFHTAALLADGTAVAVGYNESGQCDLQDWKNLIGLSAGGYHTLGLRADGTVIAAGFNDDGRCNVETWKDIIAVSGGGYHSVGLRSDGMVVATGLNDDGQCNVSTWKDIIAISAGERHTVGLKADGTVVAVGRNDDNQCTVGAWCDVVAISAGGKHTAGLKTDGSVLIIGNNEFGQCDAKALMKDES